MQSKEELSKELNDIVMELAHEALFDTKDEASKELNRQAARQNLQARLWQRLQFADPVALQQLYEESIDDHLRCTIDRVVNMSKQRVGRKGLKATTFDPKNVRNNMYLEMVSWRVEGRASLPTKYLGDCSAAEMAKVIETYDERIDAPKPARRRYQAIWEHMVLAGAAEGTTVAEFFG